MKIEFNTETDSPALLLHIAKFFETTTATVDRRVAPTIPAPINAPVASPLPELKLDDADLPDAGAISTLAEISQLGFGQDAPPQINPATVGFGGNTGLVNAAVTHSQTDLPTQPINTSGVEVDKSNCPHDSRIHSTPAKINADGLWRKRKNVDSTTFETISNQLRGIMSVSPAQHHAPIAPPPAPPIAPPPMIAPPAPPAPPIAPPPSLHPLAAPMPPAPPQTNAFVQMMGELSPMLETSGGKLRLADLEFFARNHGMVDDNGKGQVAMFQFRPDLIPNFMQAVRAHVATIV